MAMQDHRSDRAVLAELGERLRAVRLARNLSQQKLAEEAGVGRMTVQRLEEGGSTSLTSLIRILRALGELDGLARLLPPPGPSPLEEARRQGKRRQRARSSGTPRSKPQREPWRWGDERSGGGG
jgi:transcriptional regulator with XRE-family HTH domain